MSITQVRIGKLQAHLNSLMASGTMYTENMQEIYQLSQQLDELIVQYYKEYTL